MSHVFLVLNWFIQKRQSRLKVEKVSNMARLHSFYISNAQQEFNYILNEIGNDNDPFENLVPEDEEGNNDQLTEDDSDLIVGNLIKLNHTEEEMEPEKIDHGKMEFNVDEILAKVNSTKENETQ
ncbi:unnamed protein product [Rhizophagus irregularis]|nr:unnamed protein product [Rhizophagus irregularis]